jgi:hypothetical protein
VFVEEYNVHDIFVLLRQLDGHLGLFRTPPFVENADGIWHESPGDRFLMELASAWMAGVLELEA